MHFLALLTRPAVTAALHIVFIDQCLKGPGIASIGCRKALLIARTSIMAFLLGVDIVF